MTLPLPDADPSMAAQLAQIWAETGGWIIAHSTSVLLGCVLGAAIVTILLGLKWLGARIAKKTAGRQRAVLVIGGAFARTRLWFMIAVAAEIVATRGHAPPGTIAVIGTLFAVAVTLQAAVYARALILGTLDQHATAHDDISSALGVIRLLVTIALFSIAAILILSNLGINVTGLVAGLGIGGIAIGLAAQGIFSDLFAALSILFDRPFRVGDSIRWETTNGAVEAIGIKTTRIRALTGEQVVISNTNLLSKEIHNFARLARRRIIITLTIAYRTSPDLCARIPTIAGAVVADEKAVFVRCGLVDFARSSLDFELHYDVESEDYETVFGIRHRINLALLTRFADAGINFA